MAKKTDLNLIILNYNGLFWLKKLLPSIKKNYLKISQYQIEVTVVDNASTDDSVKFLKQNFKWVTTLESEKNGGFAYGNNLALRQNEARYIMLLNSDTEFLAKKSNLDPLIKYLDENKQVAALTPRVQLSDGKLDWASHRGEPTPWVSFTYAAKLEKLFPARKLFNQYHLKHLDLNSIHPVDAISGAAMMVRASAIKEVGLLDEAFFMYGEDLDWCHRFRDAGYQIIFHPGATIVHHKYKSGIKSDNKKTSAKIRRHFYDTMLQYYDKYYLEKYPKIVRNLIRYYIFVKKDGR